MAWQTKSVGFRSGSVRLQISSDFGTVQPGRVGDGTGKRGVGLDRSKAPRRGAGQ